MKDFLIDLFFITGAVVFIGLSIFIIMYCYFFLKEFLSHKKWFARIILDNAIKTQLKKRNNEDLEKWFEEIRQTHKRLNKWK